jgi:KDO2-lipid IV(A) lauroyltransferase
MKNYVFYYLIILPLSHLPFRILYILSDIMYLVLYRLIGYRKKVVHVNISRSFPEKSAEEVLQVEKEFNRHLCDLIVESLKTFTISEEESQKRLKVRNPEVTDRFFNEGKSIVGVGGHNGNWELYAVGCARQIKHRVVALYTPLNNKFFDKALRESRSRFGLNMTPTSSAKEALPKDMIGQPTMVIFGIDQCPRKTQRAYWMNFLNQETGVQFGAEKYARDHNLPVVFGNLHKVKRGYYEVEYKVVCEDPSRMETGEITEKFTRMLENIIKEKPQYWLWSHKRWKYRREECVG